MAERFSLKDQLFNSETVGQLASEYAAALPYFDADRFRREALAGFAGRELMARLDWLADCIETQLPTGFPDMADALEEAMPDMLDPTRSDDDFGQFIHAVPGILAVRHGLENHRARSMSLLHAATRRFSMEFYIRPFLNRWPDETLSDLRVWSEDDNYHVRRLVSEGTRPKLPWAKAVSLRPDQTLPLLDRLAGDPTRYVTRSVANHLNDISKSDPDLVVDRLDRWRETGLQGPKELGWMTRHALRTLVKSGHAGALASLGFRQDVAVSARVIVRTPVVDIGEALEFDCEISAPQDLRVLVDYRIGFFRPAGRKSEKVFKLKQGRVSPGKPFAASKKHVMKGDATTFRLHPGTHTLVLQVNGADCALAQFELRAAPPA